MKPKIALCLIVKSSDDEAKLLDNCLNSIYKHVDGIFLNINHKNDSETNKNVLKVANKYKAKYIETVWENNFAKSRNENFAQVPENYDFIMWLDTDDIVENPEKIKEVASITPRKYHGIFARYDYEHDEYGNVTVYHYVARMVRNDGSFWWKSSVKDDKYSVHETLQKKINVDSVSSEDFKIIHKCSSDHRDESLVRNISILENMFKYQLERHQPDPRTIFYLATHYYDAKRYKECTELFYQYLKLSGWSEERSEAHAYLGDIYLDVSESIEHAQEEYIRALSENQNNPSAYIGLAKTAFISRRFKESADWAEKCIKLPKTDTTIVQRPMETNFSAHVIASKAFLELGGHELEKASKHVSEALKIRPFETSIIELQEIIENVIKERDDIKAASRLIKKSINEKGDVLSLVKSFPKSMQDNPLLLETRFKYQKPKKHGEKNIAIFCGQEPLGLWDYTSLSSGIGGSEEAVVQLSRELDKLGWKVTVYATPYENSFDGNVEWKQYYEFNPYDEYNILISWRNPMFFDADIKAKKNYLWLHDVVEKEELTENRLSKIDKVIFVGAYHASLYDIPENKKLISGNGIVPKDFEKYDKVFRRKKHRMIYMSAHERGLKVLLNNWDKIKKEVPDATLDIYYGWQSYDAANSNNPERMAWKNEINKLIDSLDGVTNHGRIGHCQIIEEINKADIFAYPCTFPEVYCISYVKAMAGGAIPITSDYGELLSYKDNGGKQIHLDNDYTNLIEFENKYTDALIEALKTNNYNRSKMEKLAREKYSWAKTAEQWGNEFKEG